MKQPSAETVLTQRIDDVYTITLNRPAVLNALDLSMFTGLAAAIAEAEREPDIRAVVLRGAGGHFCSGADLNLLQSITDPSQADALLALINRFLGQLAGLDKPTVAVIEGAAVGAGLNLALHADFVIASEDALLQAPFVQLGLTTDFGGTYLLPRLVGPAQARRLALLGERIAGSEAERIGLIYKAVPQWELEQTVDQLLAMLRRLPRQAYAVTKAGLAQAVTSTLTEMLSWEQAQQAQLLASPEVRQLIAAKRKQK